MDRKRRRTGAVTNAYSNSDWNADGHVQPNSK
jgi:hypothetical protein